MRARTALVFATAIATTIGCATESDELVPEDEAQPQELALCPIPPPPIDIDRSLFVSPTLAIEQAELRQRFSVGRIMKHILVSSGAQFPADGTELFRRWWDTQNSAAIAQFPDNPHCDDNGATINGFPVTCPRNEGQLATALPDSHFPIALVFRPDLAPRDGSTCGEARIVIAKPNNGSRNLPIFEASIPNPDPSCGLTGCRKIAEFWARLSTVNSFSQRLDALERFYFFGLNQAQDGVVTAPVLNASNLGLPSSTGVRRGQIRTNQFMTGPFQQLWQLREFQLAQRCTILGCKLFMEPVTVKTNPFGTLFNDGNPQPLGPAFRTEFLDQVKPLLPQDVNQIGMSTSSPFNAGQSNAQLTENNYAFHFGLGNPAGFRLDITNKLASLGSALTADNIVARATTQACAGCHQLSNLAPLGGLDAAGNPLRWPASAVFVHTLETGGRSPALNNFFLPARKKILEDFLASTCTSACALSEPDPTPISGKMAVH